MSPKLSKESLPNEGSRSKFVRKKRQIVWGSTDQQHCELASEELGVKFEVRGGSLGYFVDDAGLLSRNAREIRVSGASGSTNPMPGSRQLEEREETAKVIKEITGIEAEADF